MTYDQLTEISEQLRLIQNVNVGVVMPDSMIRKLYDVVIELKEYRAGQKKHDAAPVTNVFYQVGGRHHNVPVRCVSMCNGVVTVQVQEPWIDG